MKTTLWLLAAAGLTTAIGTTPARAEDKGAEISLETKTAKARANDGTIESQSEQSWSGARIKGHLEKDSIELKGSVGVAKGADKLVPVGSADVRLLPMLSKTRGLQFEAGGNLIEADPTRLRALGLDGGFRVLTNERADGKTQLLFRYFGVDRDLLTGKLGHTIGIKVGHDQYVNGFLRLYADVEAGLKYFRHKENGAPVNPDTQEEVGRLIKAPVPGDFQTVRGGAQWFLGEKLYIKAEANATRRSAKFLEEPTQIRGLTHDVSYGAGISFGVSSEGF